MLRAGISTALVAAAMAVAGQAARADVYTGSFAGIIHAHVVHSMPGFPEIVTDTDSPGGFGFFAVFDPAVGTTSYAGIYVGDVLATYQAGYSNMWAFEFLDSAPGQGADSLSLSFATGGTAGFSHATISFSDPTGDFFETGVAGYGTSASADATDSQGLPTGIFVLSIASSSIAVVVPEPSSLAMTGLAGAIGLVLARRARTA
jgi:hypothetical protein